MTAEPDSQGPIVDADHPWLGLHPFTEETRRFFFGRDQEIRDIFLRVRQHPLTVLYGQSGLGKTSLLGAGLIPKLRVEGYSPALIQVSREGQRSFSGGRGFSGLPEARRHLCAPSDGGVASTRRSPQTV